MVFTGEIFNIRAVGELATISNSTELKIVETLLEIFC
jgi:hypothetical protein